MSCLCATRDMMRLILGGATTRTKASGTVAAWLLLSLVTSEAILLPRTNWARPGRSGGSALSQWQPLPGAASPLFSLPEHDAGVDSSADGLKITEAMYEESAGATSAPIESAPGCLRLNNLYSVFLAKKNFVKFLAPIDFNRPDGITGVR